MSAIGEILRIVLMIYWLILIARLVFDFVQIFARSWQPSGPVLLIAEFVYTITDPPLRALRKVIPPLRLGGVSLDLAFLVLILGVQLLMSFVTLL